MKNSSTIQLSGLRTRAAGLLTATLLAAHVTPTHAQTASTWNGGSGNWSNAGFWTPSGVPNSANADVLVDGGKTAASAVFVDGNYTVGRLTVDAGDAVSVNNSLALTVTNAGGFTGSGSLVNNGTLTLVSFNGFQTSLVFDGATSLSGGGVVNLQEASRIRGAGTLTNTSTILGSGSVGNNELSVVNRGVIDASGGGTITLDAAPGAGTFTNQGLLRGTLNSVLLLTGNGGGTFNNTGGTIAALGGGQVQLLGGATVTGGTFATLGAGTIRTANSDAATLGSLTNSGTFIASNNSVTTLLANTTLTNNGTFTLESFNGFQTGLVLTGNATLAGAGTLTLSEAARIRGAGTLTNAAGHTIRGETSRSGSIGAGQLNITNNGLILADTGSHLNIDTATLFFNAPAPGSTTGGIVRATNGSSIVFTSGNVSILNAGLFAASGSDSAGNGSSLTVPAAALYNYSSGTLEGGAYTASGATNTSLPTAINLSGATVTTNAATIKLIGPGSAIPAINSMTTNRGTFALDGNRTFTTVGALSSTAGVLAVARGSTLAVNGAFTQSGGNIVGAGTVSAASQTISGGIAPGAFTLSETVTSFSEFDPTLHAAGSLTLQGTSVVFTSGASLTLSLGASAGPGMVGANNDHLFVTGAFTLDGTLNINARSGFGPGAYDILDYSGGTLVNNVLDLGTVPAGYTYAVDLSTAGQVNLIVSAVPEPSTYALALGGLGLLLLGQRRVSRSRRGPMTAA